MGDLKERQKEKKRLEQKLLKLKEENVDQWEKERSAVSALADGKRRERDAVSRRIYEINTRITQMAQAVTAVEQELLAKDREFMQDDLLEAEFAEYMAGKENPRYEKLKDTFTGRLNAAAEARDQAFQTLMDARGEYARKYPNRNFSITSRDNREYEKPVSYTHLTLPTT